MKVQILNNIAQAGLDLLEEYKLVDENGAEAIVLRSHSLLEEEFDQNLLAVARAGAGVNNVPIERLSEQGVVVFNTPGANANAVKELVITAMLLAARNIFPAYDFVKGLEGDNAALKKKSEAEKKHFSGTELQGKTLGVIGLGAIGVQVANTAGHLGMKVIGYDPAISVKNAWHLSAQVKQAMTLEEIYQNSDYLTFHVPLIEQTKDLFNVSSLEQIKNGVTVINFSRAPIVNSEAILQGIKSQTIKTYVCDFPETKLLDEPQIIVLPHLGASTKEAELNCATMACRQLKNFLEKGIITNSVNFPNIIEKPKAGQDRAIIINRNVPNVLANISGLLGEHKINIDNLINKSRGDYACTIIDAPSITSEIVQRLSDVEHVVKVRKITAIS